MNSTSLILVPFLIWSLITCIDATKYVCTNTVPNTPGGQTFDKEVGVAYVEQVMPEISEFIFKVFEEKNAKDRRDVPLVNVYITDFSCYGLESANTINISAPAIQKNYIPRSKSKLFLYALLLHETTHVYQWNGNFGAPTGLTEGIADYVVIKSGYYDKLYNSVQPGEGNKWDDGYGKTARFLEYCDTLLKGFTAKLNKMMRNQYRDSYWVDLLGKPVDQLWKDYKVKYGKLH